MEGHSTPCSTAAAEDEAIAHLLNRAAYGPTRELMEHVRCVGRAAWIEEQLHPADIDDPALMARLAAYPSLEMSTAELLASYPRPVQGMPRDPKTAPGRILTELNASFVTHAVHGRAQLEAVLVDFWHNHFNVFAADGPTRWTIMAYARDTIRPHVLGRFEDLLRATAESPAMLYYLDNYLSAAPGTRGRASGINENYARELMELHTLGVDGGYTQADVGEVARAFTGWTTTGERTGSVDFLFRPQWHDTGSKTVLGVQIGPGQIDEGYEVLHLLAQHPSTAQYIATRLVTRLVSDDPPADLVAAARDAFVRTDGDLREMVRTILTADAFYEPGHHGAKVKAPFEFVASALRALGADVSNGVAAARLVGQLGQPLLQCVPPTGWPDVTEEVVSVGGMLSRFDAAWRISSGAVQGARLDSGQWDYLTRGWRVINRLLVSILQRPASLPTRQALQQAALNGADPTILVALALASPEFQQQ